MRELSDEYLLLLIDEADRELHAKGLNLSARRFRSVAEVCSRLGYQFIIGGPKDPFIDKLHDLTQCFFRPKDGGAPSIFSGLMAHLGFTFQVHVPVVYGHVKVNPFDHTDATEWQLRRIYRVSHEFDECFKQVCDVWDVGTQLAPLDGKKKLLGRVSELFDLSAFHLTAAVCTLSQRSANRGAAQSALISSELAIKALHLENGRSEDWIKKNIGHDLNRGLDDLTVKLGIDAPSVKNVIQRLPSMVGERYGDVEVPALKMNELVLLAQSVLAAVARALCGFGYRDKFKLNAESTP